MDYAPSSTSHVGALDATSQLDEQQPVQKRRRLSNSTTLTSLSSIPTASAALASAPALSAQFSIEEESDGCRTPEREEEEEVEEQSPPRPNAVLAAVVIEESPRRTLEPGQDARPRLLPPRFDTPSSFAMTGDDNGAQGSTAGTHGSIAGTTAAHSSADDSQHLERSHGNDSSHAGSSNHSAYTNAPNDVVEGDGSTSSGEAEASELASVKRMFWKQELEDALIRYIKNDRYLLAWALGNAAKPGKAGHGILRRLQRFCDLEAPGFRAMTLYEKIIARRKLYALFTAGLSSTGRNTRMANFSEADQTWLGNFETRSVRNWIERWHDGIFVASQADGVRAAEESQDTPASTSSLQLGGASSSRVGADVTPASSSAGASFLQSQLPAPLTSPLSLFAPPSAGLGLGLQATPFTTSAFPSTSTVPDMSTQHTLKADASSQQIQHTYQLAALEAQSQEHDRLIEQHAELLRRQAALSDHRAAQAAQMAERMESVEQQLSSLYAILCQRNQQLNQQQNSSSS